jgi:hypothetical protein
MLARNTVGVSRIASSAGALDEAGYAAVLAQDTVAVSDLASTRVDYAALRSSPEWDALIRSLAGANPSRLRTREERLAFWINAYNILAIDLVLRHYPQDSIRGIGSLFSPVWKRPAGRIGGRTYSLDEVENEILRPMGDPRIHGAIVCASLSCPPLRREPYRAETLDEQLQDNVRRWLADPRKAARIDLRTRTIWLSPIFDWFEEDFRGGVLPFVAAHLAPAQRARLASIGGEEASVEYLSYDWSLNDTATAPR